MVTYSCKINLYIKNNEVRANIGGIMMNEGKKIEEGLEYIKAAEKSLKTTLLKWRPDYDVAADEYTKAATCFRLVKHYEQSKDCHLKAAECHRQHRSLFHAARSLEQAILICKEMGDLQRVPELADKACSWYQQQGSSDAAAAALDKAAKIIEQQNPTEALQLFRRAADVVSIEDNSRQGAEYLSKTARILVKLKRYDEAADAVRREIGLHQQSENLPAIGRLAVVLVLVQLARGDTVAAEKAFKEWGNCCDAPEVQTLEMLLQAYDEEDPEGAKRALNSSFIKHMDVEYARLARDLALPKPTVIGPPPASVRPNAAPSYVSPRASSQEPSPSDKGASHQQDGDDEFSLC